MRGVICVPDKPFELPPLQSNQLLLSQKNTYLLPLGVADDV